MFTLKVTTLLKGHEEAVVSRIQKELLQRNKATPNWPGRMGTGGGNTLPSLFLSSNQTNRNPSHFQNQLLHALLVLETSVIIRVTQAHCRGVILTLSYPLPTSSQL